jgi:hypothetical protein
VDKKKISCFPLESNLGRPARSTSLFRLNHPGSLGRAIAQAVSRWLPTAAARVQTQVWSSGILVEKVALEQVFSEYFGFPCQSSFHHILHHHNRPGQVQ